MTNIGMQRWFLQHMCIFLVCLNIVLYAVNGSELLQYDKNKNEVIEGVKRSGTLPPLKAATVKDGLSTQTGKHADEKSVDYSFIHAFVASISVIIVSELGDKTFFIAAIMAMRHSRVVVFTGAIAALGLMTVLSVFLGYATTVIPRKYTFYISTFLFAIFGLKMLKEGYEMDPSESEEELEEVSAELKKKEAELEGETTTDVETGIIRTHIRKNKVLRTLFRICSPILIQAFTMTFLAEWGDRSQLTTIILGSRENPIGVTIGGTIGHALCTGLAVMGGRMIAQKISVRTVTMLGGVLFLSFALSALFINENGEWSRLITALTMVGGVVFLIFAASAFFIGETTSGV